MCVVSPPAHQLKRASEVDQFKKCCVSVSCLAVRAAHVTNEGESKPVLVVRDQGSGATQPVTALRPSLPRVIKPDGFKSRHERDHSQTSSGTSGTARRQSPATHRLQATGKFAAEPRGELGGAPVGWQTSVNVWRLRSAPALSASSLDSR